MVFNYVPNIRSDIIVDILQLQETHCTRTLLCVENVPDILYLDCDGLAHLKKCAGFTLTNGDYIIRPGVKESFDFLVSLKLRANADKHGIQSNTNTGNKAPFVKLVCKPLEVSTLKIGYDALLYDAKPSLTNIEIQIDNDWSQLINRKDKIFFNDSKYRLHSWHLIETKQLVLKLDLTDYKHFVATHHVLPTVTN
ncbi:unnamed protein product [Didymodactylos carnosus]|uniref:Uncharacterized protein n=1 Tax=Didymodactylos carnosus TaxID=1234261 RepID=A0A814XFU3_9BILA|nr:unnamed protein product [Didymodactylos carnosus]CAF1218710.1 unnamed protein product [Didymodactylos carnosus]CAF3694738.1 unnamed protein product [Didymodactylos carnosus]CAF3982230.1 unnamed protein product [Didymodactylos carnosus]